MDQILGLFDETPFLVFEAITTSILVACLSLMWNKNEKFDKVRFLMFAYTAGFLGGQQNLFLKGVGTLGPCAHLRAVLSVLLGQRELDLFQMATCCHGCASFHQGGLAFKGEDVFGNWQIWVFVLGMGTLAFLQLVILNQGLARFPALVFIPSYTVLYIVMGTGLSAGLVANPDSSLLTVPRGSALNLSLLLCGCRSWACILSRIRPT